MYLKDSRGMAAVDQYRGLVCKRVCEPKINLPDT